MSAHRNPHCGATALFCCASLMTVMSASPALAQQDNNSILSSDIAEAPEK